MHIRRIYDDGELLEQAACKEHLQVRREGGRSVQRQVKFYNLDVVLAVGYRVRSLKGVQFRQSRTCGPAPIEATSGCSIWTIHGLT